MHTGIDMGLSVTSIVTMDDEGKILFKEHFGTKINDDLKAAVKGHIAERYLMYYDRIFRYFKDNSVTGTVVMEDPMGSFMGNAKRLGELKGVFLVALAQLVPVYNIHTPKATAIKKAFTCSGRASKEDMIAECKNRGYLPRHEHEADAIAMALMSIDCNL